MTVVADESVVSEKSMFSVYWHDSKKKLCQIDAFTQTHKGAIGEVKASLIINGEDCKGAVLVMIKGGIV